MKQFDLKSVTRPNIWNLKPYSSARDEFTGSEGIFLDANENPYGDKNRYPDPHQRKLKAELAKRKGVPAENVFIGNGSDEVIDLVYRIFCEPGKDKVILCPPTYGMYEVSANINNIGIIEVPLTDDFQLDVSGILNQEAKCVFVCSPNNPTGNRLENIDALLQKLNGIVIVDEAYIDFDIENSYVKEIFNHPNLIVMQTFSKAWALASARVGVAYADQAIIRLMDKTKPPYNVSAFNQKEALKALEEAELYEERVTEILNQRVYLEKELLTLDIVKKVYPSDANFLLAEVTDADKIYNLLVDNKIITRNRNNQIANCIRITVGTSEENIALIEEMKKLEVSPDSYRD